MAAPTAPRVSPGSSAAAAVRRLGRGWRQACQGTAGSDSSFVPLKEQPKDSQPWNNALCVVRWDAFEHS